jgi:hypothetical protein
VTMPAELDPRRPETTEDGNIGGTRLFRPTEYERAERALVSQLLFELPVLKSPLLAMFRREVVEGARATRTELDSGALLESPGFAAGSLLSLSVGGAIHGDIEGWYCSIDESADQMTAATVRGLTEQLDASLEASGQTVDGRGQPLSWDLLLDAFESMEWSFDKNGNPVGKSLVVAPEMAERLSALPEPTPAQDARYEAIMARKREDFLARRGHRQLPRRSDGA